MNLNVHQQSNFRIERDTFGELQVPADRYWGAQTQRYASASFRERGRADSAYSVGRYKISILAAQRKGYRLH